MIFKTLNSTYEMDDNAPRVRRVEGTSPELIGPDGEWREFVEAIAFGGSVVFYLTDGTVLHTSTVTDWDDGKAFPWLAADIARRPEVDVDSGS